MSDLSNIREAADSIRARDAWRAKRAAEAVAERIGASEVTLTDIEKHNGASGWLILNARICDSNGQPIDLAPLAAGIRQRTGQTFVAGDRADVAMHNEEVKEVWIGQAAKAPENWAEENGVSDLLFPKGIGGFFRRWFSL